MISELEACCDVYLDLNGDLRLRKDPQIVNGKSRFSVCQMHAEHLRGGDAAIREVQRHQRKRGDLVMKRPNFIIRP